MIKRGMKMKGEAYTIREFADLVGSTYCQVRNWIVKHGLPHIKIGRRSFIRLADYNEWLETKVTVRECRSKVEIAKEAIKDMPSPKTSGDIAAKIQRIV